MYHVPICHLLPLHTHTQAHTCHRFTYVIKLKTNHIYSMSSSSSLPKIYFVNQREDTHIQWPLTCGCGTISICIFIGYIICMCNLSYGHPTMHVYVWCVCGSGCSTELNSSERYEIIWREQNRKLAPVPRSFHEWISSFFAIGNRRPLHGTWNRPHYKSIQQQNKQKEDNNIFPLFRVRVPKVSHVILINSTSANIEKREGKKKWRKTEIK